MTALPNAAPSISPAARAPLMAFLRIILFAEAAAGFALTIGLSMLAGGSDVLGVSVEPESETSLRFAAGGAFLFAIFAAVAARGVRRRRGWAWTLSAMLQVIVAVGTGIAVLAAEWHPAYLVGFALAALVMTVLSTASVRRALGQD
ncbi:MAG TPA: hypothetical protein VF365_07470 [Candidatus Limnocylindria bacterium]